MGFVGAQHFTLILLSWLLNVIFLFYFNFFNLCLVSLLEFNSADSAFVYIFVFVVFKRFLGHFLLVLSIHLTLFSK